MEKTNPLIVMKFGGTSVSTPEKIKTIARHIKERKKNGEKIIVVVSAMGKETDRLISLIQEINPNPSLREYDHVLQTGEIVTAGLLTQALIAENVPAISLSATQLGIESNSEYTNAKIIKVRRKELLRKTVKDKVVVIPGFQGIIQGSLEITTLGRGGSDASAVAIAQAAKANMCEIYTDVDGVYTIDPRLVPNARRFKKINFMQMITMAGAGAGVLMDRAVQIAQTHNIPIKVLLSPSFGESTGGTIVSARGHEKNIEESIFLTGISIKKEVALINISNIPNKPNQAALIFKKLENINILDATQGKAEERASITILLEGKDLEEAVNKLHELPEIQISASNGLVSLSLIDPAMKDNSGYFTKVTEALGIAKINIDLLSSGETAIIVTVHENVLKNAANVLAEQFQLIDYGI